MWELSVLPKNTTQCPRAGLEPGPLDPGTSALTMRPPRLQILMLQAKGFFHMTVRLRLYKCCYSNVCAVYAKPGDYGFSAG